MTFACRKTRLNRTRPRPYIISWRDKSWAAFKIVAASLAARAVFKILAVSIEIKS